MRIGITGGTGFLGGHLATRLTARGDEVAIFTRTPSRAERVPGGCEPVGWDPTEPAPGEALSRLDAVVNLIGESVFGVWTEAKRRRIVESRVAATRNLVEGFRSASPRPGILLSSSATGYYGDGGDREITEDAPAGTGFLAETSRDWEAAAMEAEGLGVRTAILRTSLPLHPEGGILHRLLPPFRWGLGGVIGDGRQWLPWIHLEDWIELVLFALDRETAQGPYNVTSPQPVPHRAFMKTLTRVIGRPLLFRAPAFLMKLVMGKAAEETVLSGQRLLPARALAEGFSFRFPELEPALRDLL